MDDLTVPQKLALGLAAGRVPNDHARESRMAAFIEYLRAGREDKAWRIIRKKHVCGARRSSDGMACLASPLPGKKRCPQHGGMSTGARTPEGLNRIREGQRRRWAKWRAARVFADM